MYNQLAIHYIDPLIVLTLAEACPNDAELGGMLREYLASCENAVGEDEIFFKKSKLRALVNDPSQYKQKIKNIQNRDNE